MTRTYFMIPNRQTTKRRQCCEGTRTIVMYPNIPPDSCGPKNLLANSRSRCCYCQCYYNARHFKIKRKNFLLARKSNDLNGRHALGSFTSHFARWKHRKPTWSKDNGWEREKERQTDRRSFSTKQRSSQRPVLCHCVVCLQPKWSCY